jgi:hypothetical protein
MKLLWAPRLVEENRDFREDWRDQGGISRTVTLIKVILYLTPGYAHSLFEVRSWGTIPNDVIPQSDSYDDTHAQARFAADTSL